MLNLPSNSSELACNSAPEKTKTKKNKVKILQEIKMEDRQMTRNGVIISQVQNESDRTNTHQADGFVFFKKVGKSKKK